MTTGTEASAGFTAVDTEAAADLVPSGDEGGSGLGEATGAVRMLPPPVGLAERRNKRDTECIETSW